MLERGPEIFARRYQSCGCHKIVPLASILFHVDLSVVVESLKDIRQRQANRSLRNFQYAVRVLNHRRSRADRDSAQFGIKYPHLRHAHLEVVPDTLAGLLYRILRRENLDAQKRRVEHNLLARRVPRPDADIGYAEASRFHLYAKFGIDANMRFIFDRPQKFNQLRLQIAVVLFAQVSLLHLAVDIVAIGTIGTPEVFGNRNRGAGRHRWTLWDNYALAGGWSQYDSP